MPGRAQTAYFSIGYDVESTTLTYCAMLGSRGDPWGEPLKVSVPIDTVGSSTSVSAVTAATNPFANVAVGDALFVRLGAAGGNVTDMVWVTVRTDADNITVSSAVDWSAGFVFEYLDLTCGTSSTDGWINVTKFKTVQLTIQYEIGDLGGLDVTWECKEGSLVSEAIQAYPGAASDCGFGTLNTDVCTFTVAGDIQSSRLTQKIPDNGFSFCRLGMAERTSDGGTREAVHGIVTGRE